MKKNNYFLLLLFIVPVSAVFSQNKYDYIWTLGYGKISHLTSGYPFGGVVMDFNVDPPALTLQDYIIDRPKAAI